MIGVELQPVDTWFFRDGTPFTMGKAPQENVGSVFPPHPATVVGAIRAALRGAGAGTDAEGGGGTSARYLATDLATSVASRSTVHSCFARGNRSFVCPAM